MKVLSKIWTVSVENHGVFRREEYNGSIFWSGTPDNSSELSYQELESQFEEEILKPDLKEKCQACEALAAIFGPTGHCSSYRVICEDDK